MKSALALAALAVLSLDSRAEAQTTTIPKPEVFKVSNKVPNGDGTFQYVQFSTDSAQRFFNLANCRCGSVFTLELQYLSLTTLPSDTVEIWTGLDCDKMTDRNLRCVKVGAFPFQEMSGGQRKRFDIPVNLLMFPTTGNCGSQNLGTSTVWTLIDEGANFTFEGDWHIDPALTYDTLLPPAVISPATNGVEDAVLVSWTSPTGSLGDIRSYQILCTYADGTPVTGNPPSADYIRSQDICPGAAPPPSGPDAGPTTADAGPPDAGVSAALADFYALDPRYVCSGTATSTAQSIRVELGGGTGDAGPTREVMTQVVTVDPYHNPAAIAAGMAVPAPVRDGWEVYKDDGGQADGGFCFVATAAYGDYDHPYVKVLRHFRDHTLAHTGWGRAFIAWYYRHSPPWAAWLRRHPIARFAAAVALFPVVAAAWVWDVTSLFEKLLLLSALVGLLYWRRRRKQGQRVKATLPAVALVLLALLGGLGRASAQVHVEDDTLSDPEVRGPPISHWAVELKLGPYFPAVDDEAALGGNTPFKDTFGDGSTLMMAGEVDRFFLYPGGQLGVALGIGYMSTSAFAFTQDANGHATMTRSMDETGFHLLPLSLLAVYRLTSVADRSKVPLVPYAKLGLAYDIWWFSKGDGSTSNWNGVSSGSGGTLGWLGTLGLSFRADRLDPDAARNLENDLGVEHIGFFFELTYASVNGLFQSNRLHVGDFTWSAGLNFEF